jgi:hypothetical protein
MRGCCGGRRTCSWLRRRSLGFARGRRRCGRTAPGNARSPTACPVTTQRGRSALRLAWRLTGSCQQTGPVRDCHGRPGGWADLGREVPQQAVGLGLGVWASKVGTRNTPAPSAASRCSLREPAKPHTPTAKEQDHDGQDQSADRDQANWHLACRGFEDAGTVRGAAGWLFVGMDRSSVFEGKRRTSRARWGSRHQGNQGRGSQTCANPGSRPQSPPEQRRSY